MHVICDPSILWSQGPDVQNGRKDGWMDGRTSRRTVERNDAWMGILLFLLFFLLSSTFSSSYPISPRFFSHYPGRCLLFVFYHPADTFSFFSNPASTSSSTALIPGPRYLLTTCDASAGGTTGIKFLNGSWTINDDRCRCLNSPRAVRGNTRSVTGGSFTPPGEMCWKISIFDENVIAESSSHLTGPDCTVFAKIYDRGLKINHESLTFINDLCMQIRTTRDT